MCPTRQITTNLILLVVLLFFKSNAQENEVKLKARNNQETACDPACSIRIDESFDYTTNLHQSTTTNHDELVKRVVKIENEFFDAVGRLNMLVDRFNILDNYFNGNVSYLNNRINDETRTISDFTNYEFEVIRGDYNSKFNNATAEINIIKNIINNGGGGNGNPMDLYNNITKRMDILEYGKIANLTVDNGIWRRNFRVINATFLKIKANNNNCCAISKQQ